MNFSIVIITKNEESSLERCLRSLKFCDDIIIVDSGSTDKTKEIAIRYGAHFHESNFQGFGEQKNKAIAFTKHPWVLNLDADEVITDSLRKELVSIFSKGSTPHFFQYHIKRETIFLGRPIKYFFYQEDSPIRLFHKEYASFNNELVHEKVIGEGKVGTLNGPILHYSYRNLSHYLEKLNFYTNFSYSNQKSVKIDTYLSPFRFLISFLNIFIIRGSFRSGFRGLLWALLSGFHTFIKHIKAYEFSLTKS